MNSFKYEFDDLAGAHRRTRYPGDLADDLADDVAAAAAARGTMRPRRRTPVRWPVAIAAAVMIAGVISVLDSVDAPRPADSPANTNSPANAIPPSAANHMPAYRPGVKLAIPSVALDPSRASLSWSKRAVKPAWPSLTRLTPSHRTAPPASETNTQSILITPPLQENT